MHPEKDETRDPVEKLAEQFLSDVRAGTATSIDDYRQRYPQHAEAIAALFPTLMMMEDLKPAARRARDSTDTLLERNVKRLGDFCITRRIGYGGMGIVYEAQQESLDRPVAIKVFAPTLLSSPRLIRRFKREAKAAGTLHHSNIVPILGVGEQWGIHYYIMQLIDGKGLDEVIDVREAQMQVESVFRLRRDWHRIAQVGWQIASALSYAHSRNVLHRDIKPANLLLDRDGTAWIADFGLAKLTTDDDGATRTGQAIGTLRYMSPEQLEGHVDERSDIYSLGLTLYEMLTWRRAFDETDHGRLLRQKTVDVPPRPRSIDKTIPRDLETIVLKAMAREPDHRYASARALEEDLERFLHDQPILARRVSPLERLWRWSKRNRALAAACASALFLAVSVLALSLWGYARLETALTGQTVQRQRATATSTLATGALDSVFERFGIEPISGIGRAGEPMLSSEAAALLEDLLRYYEALAVQDSNNPELMLKAAEAQATIGNIRQRLGQYEDAVLAYRSAIDKYNRLPSDVEHHITVAAIHNHVGRVLRQQGHEQEGLAEHAIAMGLLEQVDEAESTSAIPPIGTPSVATRAQVEQARTHYLLGARVRPGMGPHSMPPLVALAGDQAVDELAVPASDSQEVVSLEKAIQILNRLANQRELQPAHRQLLARCLRERVHDNLALRTNRDTALEARSLDILSELGQQHPENTDYQFDLVETLAEFSVFGNALDRSICAQARARLQRALEVGEALVAKRPDVASYALVVTHAHFKLAATLVHQARDLRGADRSEIMTAATEHFSTAIERLAELVVRFPEAEGFVVWQAYFHSRLADAYLELFRPREAQMQVASAIELLEAVADRSHEPIVGELTDHAYAQLNRVFSAMGAPPHLWPEQWE